MNGQGPTRLSRQQTRPICLSAQTSSSVEGRRITMSAVVMDLEAVALMIHAPQVLVRIIRTIPQAPKLLAYRLSLLMLVL